MLSIQRAAVTPGNRPQSIETVAVLVLPSVRNSQATITFSSRFVLAASDFSI